MRQEIKNHIDSLVGAPVKDGTKLSGFVTFEENQPPRECGNCKWFLKGFCTHKVVNADPELQSKKSDSRVKVGRTDCCDFFQNQR